MSLPEVLRVFKDYMKKGNVPRRFIDLQSIRLVDLETVIEAYQPTINSITEADIKKQASYPSQRREDVIRTMVQAVVKYAVLSHTWLNQDDEFRYNDMMSGKERTGAGWEKLQHYCGIAKDSFQCRFAWADTACVDSSNQQDQQLATQSLFNWFRNAHICITYLSSASGTSDMGHDKWFYRGFPLTELLASMRMKFYGANWEPLNENNKYIDNDKADGCFLEILSKASGVPSADLRSFWPGPDRVRQKLSWASWRDTFKDEDKAYSLMGILDSRIDVRYGEGKKAITRLMKEVIPRSRECDVFAWAGPSSGDHPGIPLSLDGFGENSHDQQFNPTPHHYRLCGDRSLSIDHNRLRIRVIVLEVAFPSKNLRTSFIPMPLRHAASISKVTLCHNSNLVLHARGRDEMAVGVVDYNWTDSPDEGILHGDTQYFCFLLYKSPKTKGSWQKLLTDKVIFLTNEQELVRKLDTLDIRTK